MKNISQTYPIQFKKLEKKEKEGKMNFFNKKEKTKKKKRKKKKKKQRRGTTNTLSRDRAIHEEAETKISIHNLAEKLNFEEINREIERD